MGGATLSLPRLPLADFVRTRRFFPPFSPNAEPGPRLLLPYTRVLFRIVSFTVFFVSHERSARSNTRS